MRRVEHVSCGSFGDRPLHKPDEDDPASHGFSAERSPTSPSTERTALAIRSAIAVWSVHADYCFACRGHEPARPCHPAKLARDLELTRTNVSNHLSCLRGCGIVVAEPEGRQTRYEIADPHIAAALTALVDVTLAVDESVPCIDPRCTVPGCCDPEGAER